jgi:hypothetical protein
MDSASGMLDLFRTQNPGKNRIWDMTEPRFHYLSIAQAQEYLSLGQNTVYASGMHKQEISLLGQNASSIIGSLPDTFEYVDFGPGSGDKSQVLLEEALKQNKAVRYHGIDINETMLDCALGNISKLGIPVKGYVGDFIKDFNCIRQMIRGDGLFAYFGATFGNFHADDILYHLCQTTNPGDNIYVSAQLCLEDMTSILDQYKLSPDSHLYLQSLKQLSFSTSDLELRSRYNASTQYVEVCAHVRTVPYDLDRMIPGKIKTGDIIIHSMTLKPTRDYFENMIKRTFPKTDIYSSDTFIGAVMKKD